MATPGVDPSVLESAKQHAQEIEKLLSSSAENSEVINENFNLAVKALEEMQDIIRKKNKDLAEVNASILTRLQKENTAEGKVVSLLQAQESIHKKINDLRTEIGSNTKMVKAKRELEGLINLHDQIGKALNEQSSNLLRQTFLGQRLSGVYNRAASTAAGLPDKMTALGGAMGRLPGMAGRIGSAIGGLAPKVAALGVPVIGWISVALSLVKDLALAIFKVFQEADDAAEKFRMQMGITRTFTAGIDKDVRNIAVHLKAVGVSFSAVYDSALATVKSIGSLVAYSFQTAESISILSSQLSLSAETSAKVLRAFAQISRSTMVSQRHMLLFTARLSQAAGTNLHEVMNDIAEFSESSWRFMKANGLEMAKAAVEARRMGTSITAMSKSSAGLLNFTESIAREMEASVLMGKSIDLTRARFLAYRRDMQGLAKELYSIVQGAGFETLDPFQMKALADAVGLTEGEIAKLLQAQRESQAVQAAIAKDPALKARIKEYEELVKLTGQQARNAGEEYLMELKREANQKRMTAIQNQWNQLIQELAEEWLPVIDDVLKGIVPVIRLISKVVIAMSESFRGLAQTISGISDIFSGFKRNPEQFEKGWKNAVKGWSRVMFHGYYQIFGAIEKYIKPGSPHRLGKMWLEGFQNASSGVYQSLIDPIERFADKMESERGIGGRPVPPGFAGMQPIPIRGMEKNTAEATDAATSRIVEAINSLRSDLLDGKIASNLFVDGQRLSETVTRNARFRGGYGVNEARAF